MSVNNYQFDKGNFNICESDKAVMEEFHDELKPLVSVLGCDII